MCKTVYMLDFALDAIVNSLSIFLSDILFITVSYSCFFFCFFLKLIKRAHVDGFARVGALAVSNLNVNDVNSCHHFHCQWSKKDSATNLCFFFEHFEPYMKKMITAL